MAGAARKAGAGLFRERRRGGSCAKREEADVLFIIGASSEAQEASSSVPLGENSTSSVVHARIVHRPVPILFELST